jgi:hypothetical protein
MKSFPLRAFTALTIGLTTLSSYAAQRTANGSSSGGGGDDISQDFMSTVRNLPQVIASHGAAEFPEINLSRLQSIAYDGNYRVELRSKLSVNGAPKAALSYPDQKLTQIDPTVWTSFEMLDDGVYRKNALALHEVLVVMRVEQNNDYHISNRLLSAGNSSVSAIKPIESIGQITSTDLKSRAVINVVNYSDKTSTFYYCENRQDARTCSVLGRSDRFYTIQEIASLRVKFDEKITCYKALTFGGAPSVIAVGLSGAPYTFGMSAVFGVLVSPVPSIIGHIKWKEYSDYKNVTDQRTEKGQNIVVEPSSKHKNDQTLYGNAQDLNTALLMLN